MRQFRPDKYRNFVRRNSVAVTVYRRQPDGDQYGTSPQYSRLPETRQILIAGENEVPQSTAAGQIESVAMSAYALPEADIQVEDRIVHGTSYGSETSFPILFGSTIPQNTTSLEVVSAHDMPSEKDAGLTKYELEDA